MATLGVKSPSHTFKYKTTPSTNQTYIIIIALLIMTTYAHTNLLTSQNITHTTTHTPHTTYMIHTSTITSPHDNYTHTHNITNTAQNTIPQKSPPPHTLINNINNIGNICHITHIHLKTPKTKNIQYYTWNNSTLILLCGDIQLNPGPLSHTSKKSQVKYIPKSRQYFILNPTTLKIHYAQLERLSFTHLTKRTTNPITLGLGHLHQHKPPLSKLLPHHHTHTLTTTYKPTQRETPITKNPDKT